jgi:hypothetical protein
MAQFIIERNIPGASTLTADELAATDDAATIAEHARRGGFPADLIVSVAAQIGPDTARR